MNLINIFLSSMQKEFAAERKRIADYLCQDAFNQDDDFRVVLWRPEVQERGKETGEVDDKMKRIILTIRGNTVSSAEIMKKNEFNWLR